MLDAVTPSAGPWVGGFALTFAGAHFRAPVSAAVGAADADVLDANTTHVVARVPPGEIGERVGVAITNWDGPRCALDDAFLYQVPLRGRRGEETGRCQTRHRRRAQGCSNIYAVERYYEEYEGAIEAFPAGLAALGRLTA